MKQNWKSLEIEKTEKKPKEIFTIVVVIALIAALFATLGINLHQQFTSTGSYRIKYKGKVVEKTTTIRETETGSFPINRLHIKDHSGEAYNVVVSKDLYDRTQVGMWIKKGEDVAEVSWDKIQ